MTGGTPGVIAAHIRRELGKRTKASSTPASRRIDSCIDDQECEMPEDPRNCGSAACIVNPEGYCWCGLKWDGRKMVRAPLQTQPAVSATKKLSVKTAKKKKKVV
jgi:hypothetical protein